MCYLIVAVALVALFPLTASAQSIVGAWERVSITIEGGQNPRTVSDSTCHVHSTTNDRKRGSFLPGAPFLSRTREFRRRIAEVRGTSPVRNDRSAVKIS